MCVWRFLVNSVVIVGYVLVFGCMVVLYCGFVRIVCCAVALFGFLRYASWFGFVGVSVLAVASGLIVLICLCYCLLV